MMDRSRLVGLGTKTSSRGPTVILCKFLVRRKCHTFLESPMCQKQKKTYCSISFRFTFGVIQLLRSHKMTKIWTPPSPLVHTCPILVTPPPANVQNFTSILSFHRHHCLIPKSCYFINS